jgi:hypothetical protein
LTFFCSNSKCKKPKAGLFSREKIERLKDRMNTLTVSKLNAVFGPIKSLTMELVLLIIVNSSLPQNKWYSDEIIAIFQYKEVKCCF